MDNDRRIDLIPVLDAVDPAALEYTDWLKVGMALKQEGYDVSDWEAWSRRDARRFHDGECRKKWDGFAGNAEPVTGATIVQMAKERGWRAADAGHELGWNDTIYYDDPEDFQITDSRHYLEISEFREPSDEEWTGARQVQELDRYLEAVFHDDDIVGYVAKTYERLDDDGNTVHSPTKGFYTQTAGELRKSLARHPDCIEDTITDYDHEAGAWIRLNPLDGKGIKNENVQDYRYALVESDEGELSRQEAIIRKLELPVAALVYSGHKSLHAIVRIEAKSYDEYRRRVEYLYRTCEKGGLVVDGQNRNPSRLSRMPGVWRGEHKQFLIATNIGKASWKEWYDSIEDMKNDLPDPVSLADVWDDMPPLAPCLIEGVLRQGHKMLISGPSKAGKSFLLMELCIAIAGGTRWLNWQCARGKVLYINLEIDKASCYHRFREICDTLQATPESRANIMIESLRGRSEPLDKLAPKLIQKVRKENYIAIVIDPIYKVITGDENSADQMAYFCNQFDKICSELGCAVIYCHHHSKGAQGAKSSIDRASGSGVFGRDPDAVLDMIKLAMTQETAAWRADDVLCRVYGEFLDENFPVGWRDSLLDGNYSDAVKLQKFAGDNLDDRQMFELSRRTIAAKEETARESAWRIDGTLREFPRFEPVDIWFRHPVHEVDTAGILAGTQPDMGTGGYQAMREKNQKDAKQDREAVINNFAIEFDSLSEGGEKEVSADELAEALEVKRDTIRRWLGNGRSEIPELKKQYEKYYDIDRKVYIRKKQ